MVQWDLLLLGGWVRWGGWGGVGWGFIMHVRNVRNTCMHGGLLIRRAHATTHAFVIISLAHVSWSV